MADHSSVTELTADIVVAYLSKTRLPADDLPSLIRSIQAALNTLNAPSEPLAKPAVPAVSIKKSITPDYLICLEDGRQFKSLKRHLRASFGMSPDDYRRKWSLPEDYPMVAPNYAASRSALAKRSGLGQSGRRGSKVAANRR